jgi:hypothetical protein
MKAAIYANLAGGDPFVTCSIIKWMYDYLDSQYVDSGVMTGTWSKDQTNFTVSSVVYKEYFPFWHGEIIMTMLVLEEYFDKLKLPTV